MIEPGATWYCSDANRELLTLILHVQPNAKRTEFACVHGGHLKVRVAAPAVEGKANELARGFLADKFDLPGGRVMIRRGTHGRTKTLGRGHQDPRRTMTVEICGQAAALLARVKKLLHS